MKVDRRSFLKTVGIAAAGAGALKGLNELAESPFDKLWELMLEFNDVRNNQYAGRASLDEQIDAWSAVVEFGEKHFPEASMDGRRIEDYRIQRDFFEDHGKVYDKRPSINKKSVDNITLGSIADEWRESFSHDGWNVDYRIVLFRQDMETYNDVIGFSGKLAFWSKSNDTSYINLTKLDDECRKVYEDGKELENKEPSDAKDAAAKRLYSAIKKRAEERPFSWTGPFTDYGAFREEFLGFLVRSSIVHERMHHFYPHTEKEAYSAQADYSPESRDWVIYAISENSGLQRAYDAVKK